MPLHARHWLAGSIACVAALSPAYGEPGQAAPEGHWWFIQIAYEPLAENADPEQPPGRVEVSIAGEPVGCAWASYYRPELTEIRLTPMFLGFYARGRREDIKVEPHDELARIGHQRVTITEVGQPRIGRP